MPAANSKFFLTQVVPKKHCISTAAVAFFRGCWICAEKYQTRKQRDEKAKGRESKRMRNQKDEKNRLREAAEKQNAGWAKPQTSEVYLLLVVGLMVEIASEKPNRVHRRG